MDRPGWGALLRVRRRGADGEGCGCGAAEDRRDGRGKTPDEAASYVEELKKAKRYKRDVY